jgi:hypothetical protein
LKRVSLAVFLGFLLTSSVFAQFSGQLSTAKTVPSGGSMLGVYAGIYEDAFGVLGQYRYGLGGYTDMGFKVGVLDLDDFLSNDVAIDAAFDLKYQVMEMRMRDPFDLSLGGTFEFLGFEDGTLISFGFAPIGSYPVTLKNGRILEPYGRLQLRVERVDINSYDDTDFEIGLNMGAAFELSSSTEAIGELQFDDEFGFIFGVNFEL